MKNDISLMALNMRRYYEFSGFLQSIKKTQIRYAIIKGEPISMLAYGRFGKRNSGDIDILISKEKIEDIRSLLLSHGFVSDFSRVSRIISAAFSHQTMPYCKNFEGIKIELDINYDILWGEHEGKRIDIDDFLSDTEEMDIYGVHVKTLPPLKAIVQLSLHHYKDMNSIFLLATRKSIKYDMFKDLYYLLKNNIDEITVDKLYGISERYEIIPYVFYILYYTGQVFDEKLLKKYIEAFKTREGEMLLNCYGLNESERREWRCDFKTRLESENLYDLIKDDLTERDKEKIAINRMVFLGGAE